MKRPDWNRQTGKLLRGLASLIAAVFVLHISWQLIARVAPADNRVVADIAARLSVDSELSVPTWVSALLALLGALLAWLIGRATAARGSKIVWYGLAWLMMVVSLDEVAALHELLLQGLHILADFGEGQTLLANAWLLILPFVLGLGLAAAVFARRQLPSSTLRQLGTAAGVYLAGALVVEYLSIPADKAGLSYLLVYAVIEEALEFIGLWLVVRTCLLHITEREPGLEHDIQAILKP